MKIDYDLTQAGRGIRDISITAFLEEKGITYTLVNPYSYKVSLPRIDYVVMLYTSTLKVYPNNGDNTFHFKTLKDLYTYFKGLE